MENFDLVFLFQIQSHLKGKDKEPRLMLSNQIYLENNLEKLQQIIFYAGVSVTCSIIYNIYMHF